MSLSKGFTNLHSVNKNLTLALCLKDGDEEELEFAEILEYLPAGEREKYQQTVAKKKRGRPRKDAKTDSLTSATVSQETGAQNGQKGDKHQINATAESSTAQVGQKRGRATTNNKAMPNILRVLPSSSICHRCDVVVVS